MRVRGTHKDYEAPPRHQDAGALLFFRRLMSYVWAQRKHLIPGILCIVVMAVSYSAGIGSLVPVLKVMLSEQSVPNWVNEYIAEQRLDVEMEVFSRIADPRARIPARFDYSARLRARPGKHSPLLGQAERGDMLIAMDGRSMTGDELFRELAGRSSDEPAELTILSPDTLRTNRTKMTLRHSGTLLRIAHRVVGFLPNGTSRAERIRTLIYILGLMVSISIVQNVARFGGEYLVSVAAARTLVALRRQMYRKALRLPVSYFARQGTSDLMSRFTQDSQDIYRGLTFVFAQTIREPLKAAGVFVLAVWMAPRVVLLAAIVAPAGAFLIRYFGKRVRKATRRLLQGYARMLGSLEGALVGIRVVKGYTMERFERRHLMGVDWGMLRQQLRIEVIEAASSPLFEILGMACGAAAAVWFYNEMLDGRLDPAGFMTMVVCLVAIFDPLRKLSNLYTRVQRANAAAERVFEIIDMPVEEDLSPGGRRPIPALQQSIVFDNVTFIYPGTDRAAVQDFSLTVRRGERIAIVGPNGSGKTTLLAMLTRFFEPQKGCILFDGVDIAKASLQSVRGQISLVTQETVIFADTVRNNIAYGEERLLRRLVMRDRHPERHAATPASEERVTAAARAAYADEFIRELPDGYDTQIGEHGATLSGGQRQRIAIARAILRNAPILIFDEATSQIDSDSENKIHRALEAFLENRTGFIIAHRFSTILQADRIVVMDDGRLLDAGRHEELLGRCLLYRTLFETQLRPPRSEPPGPAAARAGYADAPL